MIIPFLPLSIVMADAVSAVRSRNSQVAQAVTVRRARAVGAEDDSRYSTQDCRISSSHLRLVDPDEGSAVGHYGFFHDGRLPGGLQSDLRLGLGPLPGDLFAQLAHNKAASALAYRRLARELRRMGAPSPLIHRVRRALSDEIRHTRVADALAARYGAEGARPTVLPAGPRDLATLARDNLIEGCVHETYGAAIALWQSEQAEDPLVQASLRDVARDQARHAQLAWDVHRWLSARLDDEERSALETKAQEAVRRLHRSPAPILTPDTRATVGLPDPTAARALVRALFDPILSR